MTTSITPQQIQPLKLDGISDNASIPFVFESFDLPSTNQRLLDTPSLSTVISTIQTLQKDNILTQKLSQHGTLLFRNLPLHSASDFSAFAHAFNFTPHEIIGIVVNRPLLAPNVAPANEAPPNVLIYNHNESPQVPHAPEYIFFYCDRAPEVGGETPISSSLELFSRAQAEIPEFVTELAEKGIRSSVTYKPEKQYEGGSTLAQAFGKEIVEGDDEATRREKIEAQIRRYGRGEDTTWEWEDGGKTLVLTHHLPAIRTQVGTGLPTLFTGLAAYWRNFVNGGNEKRRNVTKQLYGDGTPIPERYIEKLAEITEDIRVLHKWERGDVLVYDNVISQHGRQPWVGEQGDRVVLASLWDGDSVPGRFAGSHGSWAQVVQAKEG